MKNLVKMLLTIAALALSAYAVNLPRHTEREPLYKDILIRDFRKGKDGVIVNYNIGTTAHCPGTIASLRKVLPDDIKITVWAASVGKSIREYKRSTGKTVGA